jgi:SAM-dependent methyltransferase
MPLQLSPEEHQALFETHQGPAPMLDLLGAAALRMAAAATRLGVFQALSEGPLTPDEVAGRTGTHPRGTALLLDALRAHGYVRLHASGGDGTNGDGGGAERYENSDASARWLVRRDGPSFADTVEFWDALLFGLWPSLERSLTEGHPPTDWYAWLERNPTTLRSFQAMLGRMARGAGPGIVTAAALPESTRRLLDVGGSHALYSAAFCAAHPQLHATVLDFPGALEIGRENVKAEGLEERIELRAGDFIREPLGEGYDAVLLCRVVHGLDAEGNVALLRKAHDALAPGGRVLVVEEYDPGQRPADAVSDAFMHTFSLNMYHLQGAQNYPTETIAGWLREAGFDPATVRETPAGNDRVIQAAKAAAADA